MPSPMGARVDAAPGDNAGLATYANSAILKASKGILYGVTGYNSGPAQFIQLHDSATVPADTAVPVMTVAVGATQNFSIDFGLRGKGFLLGIVACNSTTGPTKTIGAANCSFEGRTA